MKKTLTYFVLGLLVTSSITACSLIPRSAEPELGAALASTSADQDHGTSLAADGVQFNTDEATLQPGANKMVSEAVDYLRSNPGSQVIIEGHTDRTGSKSYNQKLSEKRAIAIAKAINTNGISKDRITAFGFGETKPIADNNTRDGRRANRRVEIRFAE